MKPRAPRQKVLISTRMRVGAGWNDACILNISVRGVMIQTASPPPKRGSYVELRRGPRIIIGRVMWTNDQRFGLSTQDPLDVESIIAAADGDTNEVTSPSAAVAVERRSAVRRNSAAFEHSRQWARAFEFACLTVLAVTGCMVALGAVAQLFVGRWPPSNRGSSALRCAGACRSDHHRRPGPGAPGSRP